MNTRPLIRYFRLPLIAATALLAGAALAQPGMHGGHGRHHGAPPFEQIDTDKDGKITRAEAQAFAAAQRAGLDADGDGFVSYEEAKAHRQARREQRARERFAAHDRNGDGKVALDEMPDPGMRMFDRLDENDDGVIDDSERPQRGRGGQRGQR